MSGRLAAGLARGVLLALVAAGCGTGTSMPTSVPSLVAPTPSPSPDAVEPTPTAPPGFVGDWEGVHSCERIVAMLTDAGLEAQILQNIVGNALIPGVDDPSEVPDPADPCVGSVEQPHSHFFTARGTFGSRDQNGDQVDDGTWTVVDDDTLAIGDAEFDYSVSGEQLFLTPVSVGACPPDPEAWCPEAWKLMVAMPGMAWVRS